MEKLKVCHFESGLIIEKDGLEDCIVIPNYMKYCFYEDLLTACLNNQFTDYNDINGNEIILKPYPENAMSCFINNVYSGELDYVLLNENSIAIPVETEGTFDYFEVYDSRLMECYLLEKEEVLRLSK